MPCPVDEDGERGLSIQSFDGADASPRGGVAPISAGFAVTVLCTTSLATHERPRCATTGHFLAQCDGSTAKPRHNTRSQSRLAVSYPRDDRTSRCRPRGSAPPTGPAPARPTFTRARIRERKETALSGARDDFIARRGAARRSVGPFNLIRRATG